MRMSKFPGFPLATLTVVLLCAGTSRDRDSTTSTSTRHMRSRADAGMVKQAPNDAGHPRVSAEDAGSLVESKAHEPFSFPDVDELQPGDVRLEGAGYHALRVAIEDLLPPGRKPPPDKLARCLDDEASYHYQVQRRGELYFIRIVLLPERCDPKGVYVDGGVRYVVSADGRILRNRYDGQPD